LENQALKRRLLEVVWSSLSERRWRPFRELEKSVSPDAVRLMHIIDFLVFWEFAEARYSPALEVRRKPGALPPVDVVELLGVSKDGALTARKRGFRLAERVACRLCGWKTLQRVGLNEVECVRCHERQWYTIEVRGLTYGDSSIPVEAYPRGRLRETLVRLGFPQFAFIKNIPDPTRYYYFMCNGCRKISVDYAHGHSRYFICPHCGR
jgi:hypothetical protein